MGVSCFGTFGLKLTLSRCVFSYNRNKQWKEYYDFPSIIYTEVEKKRMVNVYTELK